MTEHEHKDEHVVLTSPDRMLRGIIIVVVTLAIGTVVTVTQFDNFFSQAPPVSKLTTVPPPPPPPPAAGVTTISILAGSVTQGNPDYEPDDAMVPLGNKVVWNNLDNVFHTATSGTGTGDPNSGVRFDTGLLNGGQSSDEITIDGEVGDVILYYCFIHPYMTSQLTIVEAEEATGSGSLLTILAGSVTQGNPDYDPDPMVVTAGDMITVFNADNIFHTVTSGTGTSDPNTGVLFDSGLLNLGQSATIDTTGLDPGTYPYFCIIHPYMVGSLQVT